MGAPLKAEHKLLDTLIANQNLRNDADLARKLEMAPPQISKVRNRIIPVGPEMILRIHEKFGIPVVVIRGLMD